MWVQSHWILCLTDSHKAAIKVSAYVLLSHLKDHLGKAHLETVGSIQCLAHSWMKGIRSLLSCCMGFSNVMERIEVYKL